MKSKSRSSSRGASKKVKIQIHNDGTGSHPVDVQCSLHGAGSVCSVIRKDKTLWYSATLNCIDLEKKKNSFYILQIVTTSTGQKFLHRRWGLSLYLSISFYLPYLSIHIYPSIYIFIYS